MPRARAVLASFLPVLLAACGGGGDAPSSPAAPSSAVAMDKYMGTWTFCFAQPDQPSDGISARETFTLVKTSDNTASLVETHDVHTFSNACGGAPVNTVKFKGTVTFLGEAQVGADSAAKVQREGNEDPPMSPNGYRSKWFYSLSPDGKLHAGPAKGLPGASMDAQGFPSAVDTKDWVTYTRK